MELDGLNFFELQIGTEPFEAFYRFIVKESLSIMRKLAVDFFPAFGHKDGAHWSSIPTLKQRILC